MLGWFLLLAEEPTTTLGQHGGLVATLTALAAATLTKAGDMLYRRLRRVGSRSIAPVADEVGTMCVDHEKRVITLEVEMKGSLKALELLRDEQAENFKAVHGRLDKVILKLWGEAG